MFLPSARGICWLRNISLVVSDGAEDVKSSGDIVIMTSRPGRRRLIPPTGSHIHHLPSRIHFSFSPSFGENKNSPGLAKENPALARSIWPMSTSRLHVHLLWTSLTCLRNNISNRYTYQT